MASIDVRDDSGRAARGRRGQGGARCLTRRGALAVCAGAVAALACGAAFALAGRGSSPALAAAARADSSEDGVAARAGSASSAADRASSSAASSADATAKGNSARRFEDIPSEALMTVDDLYDLTQTGAVTDGSVTLLDIRSHRDYTKNQIEGSRNIPAGRQIEIRLDEIPTDEEVILIAYKNSDRLAETYYTLLANGYDAGLLRVVDGGIYQWMQKGYPVLTDQFLGC
ncbi:MAG: rhodanese-like domain-containing protein [Coriobacteriales bacterium]|jgi:rhodanese-related sulfurtransferase